MTFNFSGERDLQRIWQLPSLLHLNLVQPDEEKAQGPAACHRVNGKTFSCKCLMFISIEDEFYNAWEEDIAVVNIFFGKGTVMGEKNLVKDYLQSSQSLREASEWVLWTLLLPLEGSLVSVLASASSHSSRLSTGFLPASARPLSTRCLNEEDFETLRWSTEANFIFQFLGLLVPLS